MNQNKTFITIYLSSLMFALGGAVLYLRNNFIFSDQEIQIWSILSKLGHENGGYNYLLAHAPLAFTNIMGIFLKLTGNFSFLGPYFISLSLFLFCLFLNFDYISKRSKTLYRNIFIFSLFLFHPYVLWILLNCPLEIFIIVSLFAFTSGLVDSNSGNQGRGILLMAISSPLILLSGNIGVAILLAIICSAPLFLKSDVFQKSLLGGHIILSFPGVAAFFGLVYLSWLYKIPIENIIFHTSQSNTSPRVIFHWIPFLILIIPLIFKIKTLKISGFLLKLKSPIILFISLIILIMLGRDFKLETMLGLAALGMGFEYLNRSNIRTRHFFKVALFLLASWALELRSPLPESSKFYKLQKSVSSTEWIRVNHWLGSGSDEKVLFLSHQYAPYSLVKEHAKMTLNYLDDEFSERIRHNNFDGIDKLVIELPEDSEVRRNWHLVQKKLFFNPPKSFKLADKTERFRLYTRGTNPSLLDKNQDNSLFFYLTSPLSPFFDALRGGFILLLLILSRLYYLHKYPLGRTNELSI